MSYICEKCGVAPPNGASCFTQHFEYDEEKRCGDCYDPILEQKNNARRALNDLPHNLEELRKGIEPLLERSRRDGRNTDVQLRVEKMERKIRSANRRMMNARKVLQKKHKHLNQVRETDRLE